MDKALFSTGSTEKIKTGADAICKGCKHYKTDACKNWKYWEGVAVGFANCGGMCAKKKVEV